MSFASCDTLAVTRHTVYALTGLGKYELLYALLADLAIEAVGVVRVVARHDRLVEDRLLAHRAAVRAVRADRRAVREQEQVRVRRDLVPALGALEAVDVEERLPRGREDCG